MVSHFIFSCWYGCWLKEMVNKLINKMSDRVFDFNDYILDMSKGDSRVDILINVLYAIREYIRIKKKSVYDMCEEYNQPLKKYSSLIVQYAEEHELLLEQLKKHLNIDSIGFCRYVYFECFIIVIRNIDDHSVHIYREDYKKISDDDEECLYQLETDRSLIKFHIR
jgi:hypothetical protein